MGLKMSDGAKTEREFERREEQFWLLTQSGPETPMGVLLRKFWHPVALSSEIMSGSARPIRIFGEDLTLYRGESGSPHLIGGRCAHRCTVLHTGLVSGDELSCMYHGWRYNSSGLCVDIPAEKRRRSMPPSIAAYPVYEYCGLIFAYLGKGSAPEFDLPRKAVFEDPKKLVIADKQTWDCNWFQHVENSLDAVHVSFAHLWGAVKQFGSSISASIPELSYSETDAGICQVATRSSANVRISNWTFPNNNHVVAPGPRPSDPWLDVSAWPVPADDNHTVRFTLYAVDREWAEGIEDIDGLFGLSYEPGDNAAELFGGRGIDHLSELSLITAQDYVAMRGQGAIVDRMQENLSTSDAGVVFLRRLFMRELELVRQGKSTKSWRSLKAAPNMPVPEAAQV